MSGVSVAVIIRDKPENSLLEGYVRIHPEFHLKGGIGGEQLPGSPFSPFAELSRMPGLVRQGQNAARNVLKKGGGLGMPEETPIPMMFEPDRPPGEAMVTEPERTTVIRPADGGKITATAIPAELSELD